MFFPIKGGIYEESLGKWQSGKIIALPDPEYVIIPVCRKQSDAYTIFVSVGSRVEKNARIAEYRAFDITFPVYASISGKVSGICTAPLADGGAVPAVRIEQDPAGTERICPMPPMKDRASAADLILASAACADADLPLCREIRLLGELRPRIIVNCFDSGYGAAAENAVYAENRGRIHAALIRFAKALDAAETVVAADVKHRSVPDAAAGNSSGIRTVYGRKKYPVTPQRLIRSLYFKRIPNESPALSGYIVVRPSELLAIEKACADGSPKTSAVLTVAGDAVRAPGNYSVPVGTTLRTLVRLLGKEGFPPAKAVYGGALSGKAIWDPDTPVLGDTGAVWLFGEKAADSYNGDSDCIRCGRCAEVCPEGLLPTAVAKYVKSGNIFEAAKLNVGACVGCGCCAYVCCGKEPLLQYINTAKGRLKPHEN